MRNLSVHRNDEKVEVNRPQLNRSKGMCEEGAKFCGFCQLLGAYHPSIWKFIEALKKEQSLNELKLEQFLAGQLPPAGKKKFKDCAERLKRVVAEYGKRQNMDYLRGIAHHLELQA